MSTFKRLLPIIILCIFEFIVGVLVLTNGEAFFRVVFIIFGILLFVGGLITLIRSLMEGRKGGTMPMFPMILSVFMIGFGAFFTAASSAVLAVMTAFTLVAGIMMFIDGIFKIIEYFTLRGEGVTGIGLLLFDAIVTLLLGILLAFNPFAATLAEWIIIGVSMIVSAVFDVIAMIVLAIKFKNTKVAVVDVKVEKVADGAKETVAVEGKEVQNDAK